MTHTSRVNLTFCLGYLDGLRARAHISRSEAARSLAGLPAADIEAYLNGHDDGVRRDRTRYALAHAALADSGVRVTV